MAKFNKVALPYTPIVSFLFYFILFSVSYLTSVLVSETYEPPQEKTNNLHICEKNMQISFAVTAKLISAFVYATQIVHFLFFLNPKFQASVTVQPGLCQTCTET